VAAGGGNGLAMSPDVQRTVLALTRAPAVPVEDTVAAASAGAGFIPVHGTFMALAGRQPGAIAVRAADRTLTFAQLAEESGRLASQLRAAGVGPEQVVAISSRRIASLIVALLAVWRAGAAFLLLDPREPSVRAVSQLSDCGAALLLTVGEGPHPATGFAGPVLAAENAMAAGQPGPEPGGPGPDIPSTRPGWLAYAVFTSGSTGRPKGVLIEHGGLACRARQVSDLYRPHRAPLAVAGAAPVTYDSFIDQTLPMLTLGHTLVLLDEEERLEPTSYLSGSSRARLDVVDVPPSQLTALVGGGLLTGARRPELVVFGGERPDDETWHAIRRSGTPAVSVYGASECTGASMHAEVAEHPEVTLGRPAWSARIYVVDVRLRLLPPGLAGEICIGGPGVGRGYACAPGQTAAAFVPDPFSTVPGARMYRTGDLGMLAPDGTVSFLGRTDDQLKIRGFRVEPGEVEALIAMMPGVRRAVVVPDRRDAGGIRGLLAFVESDGTGAAQPDRVAAALKASLPGYLRPSRVSVLDAFPLTRNGKIDRKGLAAIPAEPRRVPSVPASGLQRRLCDIWREVLGVPAVGPGDDFFELGGDSLLAFRVAARIQSALGKSVTVRAIFDERTPVALAAAIDASQEPAVSPAAGSRIPLTRRPAALLNKTGGTARHPSSSPSLANGVAKK
jgi:amino acid adenylation domain-containing protein